MLSVLGSGIAGLPLICDFKNVHAKRGLLGNPVALERKDEARLPLMDHLD